MPLSRADAGLHALRREELGTALQETPPKPAFFEALREELSASSGESAATVADDLRFDEACQRAQVTDLGPLSRLHVQLGASAEGLSRLGQGPVYAGVLTQSKSQSTCGAALRSAFTRSSRAAQPKRAAYCIKAPSKAPEVALKLQSLS